MAGRWKDLGSLAIAVVLVGAVCAFGWWSTGREGTEPVGPATAQAAAPQLNLEIAGVTAPQTYLASIDALGWSDQSRRVLDMKIQSAQPVDVDASGRVLRTPPAGTGVADRLVGQRVLAVVDKDAVPRLRTTGNSRVRLVVMPRKETVHMAIQDVVAGPRSPVAAVTASAASARVTALSAYAAGPAARVTISGTGFGATQKDSWVSCCGSRASVVSWSDTAIVFTVPSGATKPGYVGVVVAGATSNGLYFTPYAAPTLTGVTPRDGAPGSIVTLDGSGFGATQRDGWVSFGGAAGQVSSWSDTRIKVSVPKGTGTCYVGVVSHGLSSNGVLFAPYGYPAVDALSKSRALSGDALTVTGRNFGASGGTVVVGGVAVRADSWSNTSVRVTLPGTVRTGYIGVVRAGGLTSNGRWLMIAPRVTGLSSWWTQPGGELTVYGQGFGATRGTYGVMIAGRAASVVSWSEGAVKVSVPSGTPSGYVGIGTAAFCSNGKYVVVEQQAHIDAVDDKDVAAGQTIAISGSRFGDGAGASRILVGGTRCAVTTWSDTHITAVVPAGASSGYLGVVKQGVASNGIWMNVAP